MRRGLSAQLVGSASRARAQLDPGDPLGDTLLSVIGHAERSEGWADLALAIRLIEPLFDRLADWPSPCAQPEPDVFPSEDLEERDALRRVDTMRWLAAMAALQAVELGPSSPMALALAAGAVALARGEAEGLGWIVSAIKLSRTEGP